MWVAAISFARHVVPTKRKAMVQVCAGVMSSRRPCAFYLHTTSRPVVTQRTIRYATKIERTRESFSGVLPSAGSP